VQDQFCPSGELQEVQHPGNAALDSGFINIQLVGDIAIAQTSSD
jgi:hypothetical protein